MGTIGIQRMPLWLETEMCARDLLICVFLFELWPPPDVGDKGKHWLSVETVKDTLTWWATVPEERRAKPGFNITPGIEARALADRKRK